MLPFRNFLIGLAGTEADGELIRYAARLAGPSCGAEVHFVHVMPPASFGRGEAGPSHEVMLERCREAVRQHFDVSKEAAEVHVHVVRGAREDELLQFAAESDCDLLIVGHRKSRSGRRALARRLAMKAPCSVWMVPEGSPERFDTPLVPVDFSDYAADALSVATALAAAHGIDECRALHVYFNEAVATYDEYDQVMHGEEEAAFEKFIAPIDRHGVRVRPIFEEGANIANIIRRVAEANRVDLIVMGTRGRSRASAVLLGSETEQTIIESRIPVLAVKHFGARLGLLQILLDKRFRDKRGVRFSSLL